MAARAFELRIAQDAFSSGLEMEAFIYEQASAAIAARGKFSIAFSGGSMASLLTGIGKVCNYMEKSWIIVEDGFVQVAFSFSGRTICAS